jgi:hypothetical protein
MAEELRWLLAALVAFFVVFSATFLYNLLFATPLRVVEQCQSQYRVLKEKIIRVKQRDYKNNGTIALVYNYNFYPACREINDDKSETYRIGVHNLGNKTLSDVEVLLMGGWSNLQPEPLPSPLSPMHSTLTSPSGFTLNPSSDWYLRVYVDFIRWQPKNKTIQLCYHHNITKSTVPFHDSYKLKREQKYFISLGATARDTRIDTQWSAEVFVDRYGKLNIDLSEVKVLEM